MDEPSLATRQVAGRWAAGFLSVHPTAGGL